MGLASPISPTGDIEGDIAGDIAVDIAVDIAGDIAGEGECTPSPMHCTRSAIILCSSSSVLLSASATMHNLHAQPSCTTFTHNLRDSPCASRLSHAPLKTRHGARQASTAGCITAVQRRAMPRTTSRRRLITAHGKLAAKLRERPSKP
jgi:hypothetical protein